MTAGKSEVLIIDDSAVDISVLTEILRPEHHVLCATDPEAAFGLIRSGARPDLIVLDVMMPGGDGLQVCRQLKADPATSGTPVIFVTARGEVEDEAAGFDAGGVDYVAKPVDPHLLRARVRAHIELKRARERLEAQNMTLQENARLREEVENITRHDLKNPLMVVLNIPGLLLRQENLTPQQKTWVRMMEEAARRMLEMVNRSIDMIKMENLAYQLNAMPVDALSITRQITGALQETARDKTVSFAVSLQGRPAGSEDAFTVMAEDLLVFSMLSNLVRNAVEASPDGSTVSISFLNNGSPTIAIHNFGAIPAEIRGRFFDKFATARKPGGTGLGAYSARLIATTLGGSIACASSEEKGTTITVHLPGRSS